MDPPWYTDGARGAHLLSAAREAGLESLVAKRLTHQYRLGQRVTAMTRGDGGM